MSIIRTQEDKYDILDIGFDRSLQKEAVLLPPPDMTHGFSDTPGSISLGNQGMGGELSFGSQLISVAVGANIQKSIDEVFKSGGGTIRLINGNHEINYNIIIPSCVVLEGEGRDSTVIDFAGGNFGIIAKGTSSVIEANMAIKDLTIKNSNATAGIDIDFFDFFRVNNVRITSCDQKGIRIQHSQNFTLDNVRSDNNTGNNWEFSGSIDRLQRNFFVSNCQAENGSAIGFAILNSGAASFQANFSFISCLAVDNTGDGYDIDYEGNVSTQATFIGCHSESNGGIGYDLNAGSTTFLGCTANSNTGDGFEVNSGTTNRLIGCASTSNGIGYDINSSTMVVACKIDFSETKIPSNEYSETDNQKTRSWANLGGNARTDRIAQQMKNVSGGSISQGHVVVFNANFDSDEITTTTTQGDGLVWGMATATVNNNRYFSVLTVGFTKLLKVDGTIDIALEDLLGTSTTAGIAMKASPGDMCFAIALEAYTTDDSNGVIDALIISPRLFVISAASATTAGKVELATAAETTTGTDATRAVTPDGLAGSEYGERALQAIVVDFTTDVATGDGKFYFHIDSRLAGMNLVDIHGEAITAGVTGTMDIQIRNVTQSADILSTKLTFDSGETGTDTAAAPAVIDSNEDDMTENDLIAVDVDAVQTTAAKGLIITLGFRLP